MEMTTEIRMEPSLSGTSFQTKRIVPLRTISLLSLLIVYNSLSIITSSGNSGEWFERIPDESMEGVPKVILDMEKYYPAVKNVLWDVFGRSDRSAKQAVRFKKTQKQIPDTMPFPCDTNGSRSLIRPTNVHRVRPGDIDVIGALGDSLTAANGAFGTSIFQVDVENRGVSFATGGRDNWRKYLTLPNIIKEFNPNVIGYTTNDANSWEKGAQFNVAHPGALSQDLPFMVKELVKRIRHDRRVDFKNDWKLITLMTGANNFCIDFCYHENPQETVEMHRREITNTLDYLKANMPRTIVNLLLAPHLRALKNLKGVSPYCLFLKLFMCPCLFAEQHKHNLNLYYELMDKWQETEIDIAASQKYRDKDDFVVNLLPFSRNASVPTIIDPKTGDTISDMSFLSRDCFHFSQKGYATVANSIWNNMMEPYGSKSSNSLKLFDRFLCPTENAPYIFTWQNS